MNNETNTTKGDFIEEIICVIEEEIENSKDSYYITKEGNEISTDVGYVKEWFDEYKKVLRKRHSVSDGE